ncbi:MAG: sn-glycerol-3-phosphate ABC transporter ATP-binding protein UgpC [bacterium]|nr:sn-glycerol-3-phosphate ABC transporter ATP-binding protein UgpC [bacterium]
MRDIRFLGVAKSYGDVKVISGLDLHVREGEFMVLVGPSGCAKSTTLRMIAGLETISSGDLMIGGERVNHLSPAQRNISMVFQSYALFPNMSVRDNLSFGLRIRKTDPATVRTEVERVADMLGLGELLARKPRQLSGGQAQRVALGRAMIRRPDAFLFDEPLSNLDAELRVQMRGEISEMQRQLTTTTVYVTHDQVEAMTMGDRIAVMNQGRIMQVGVPTELYEKPANTFVAGFIGSPRMNLHDAKDLLGDASTTVDRGCGSTLGIRPEHLLIGSAEGAVPIGEARVNRIEDLGHEALVHLSNARGAHLTVRTSGDIRGMVRAGETLSLALRPDRLHAFDSMTGERLP